MTNGKGIQKTDNMLSALKESFFSEISNWILWLVVFFAAGIAFYFSLDSEPDLYFAVLASVVMLILSILFRKQTIAWSVLLIIFFFSFGITAATWRTHSLSSGHLTKKIEKVKIYGIVEQIFPSEGNTARILLRVKRIYAEEKLSIKKLQVMTMNFNHDVRVGDLISLYASISPSSGPLYPGGYDFARHFYFHQIAGNAFSFSKIRIIEPAQDASISARIENLRLSIFRKLIDALGQVNGTVAASLMIGEQKSVDKTTMQDMRYSGLVHILSVSGLHMSLLAIICFFIVRRLLSYFPYISQAYNTKKIAALTSFALSMCYLLISGMQVAAVRSFFMLSTLMAGIVIDRQNSQKSSVFLAAFLILLLTPEAIFHPSFQMSFSAVLALVGMYDLYSKRLFRADRHSSIFNKVTFYFLGVLFSSFIAGTATSIFTMYHFHSYSSYSILANLLAAPLVSFIIMPSIVLAFFLMPFGFGIYKLALYPLDFGITWMLKIAKYISALPKSNFITPTTDISLPLLFAIGLLWLCIWERRWRLAGLLPIIASFTIIFLTPFPDIIIDERYKAVLLRNNDRNNTLTQLSGPKRLSNFHKTQFLTLLNTDQEKIRHMAHATNSMSNGLWEVKSNFQNVKGELSSLDIKNLITGKLFKVTRIDIEEHGSHFIYLNGGEIKVKHNVNRAVARPWTLLL